MPRVAVLGGGVAGLTAADELSQRHFEVDVFERRNQLGGKARSFLSTPINGLGQFPAEHGFRFFPGFYKHLPDTMERIPYGKDSMVYANLTEATQLALPRPGKSKTVLPASAWGLLDPGETRLSLLTRHPFEDNFDLSHEDLHFIFDRLIELMKTCRERRLMELERGSWLEYCRADERPPEYRTMMLTMTRSLVAARADELSARTGGDILVQLQLDKFRGHPDRLLNGPTSDVWIEPWRQKLTRAGVNFHLNYEVLGFNLAGKRLTAVNVRDDKGNEGPLTDYDWYVCALPVEVMQKLVDDPLKQAAPSLANLGQLQVRWMNGFMLYLRRDVPIVHGHSIYVGSPWALTSVSQAQFWTPEHLGWAIPGTVEGILSVDISNWENPGRYVTKPAVECTPDEIRKEVLGEIRDYCQDILSESDLSDDNIAGSFVDPDIYQPNPNGAKVNLEPLLINTNCSWASRPESHTEIDNLLLAADYVRTYTDLATMEGANEAARRAVNCILNKTDSKAHPCELFPLQELPVFIYSKFEDRERFRREHRDEFKQARKIFEALSKAHPC